MPFVIYKSTRIPRGDSYLGPTWDYAGIRDRYKTQYDSKEEAEEIAALLTKTNRVGFKVEEV